MTFTGSFGRALLGAACLVALAAPAGAQDEGTPPPTISGVPGVGDTPAAAAPAPAAPAATDAPAVVETPMSWPVMCNTPGDPATCVAIQALGIADTDQRLLTVMLQSDGAEGENIILQLPHGLLFPAGVQLSVDGGAPVQASLTTSDVSGAYAGATLTEDLSAAMRAGQDLTVTFTSVEGEQIDIPVPLQGFAAAQDARRQGTATQ